MDASITPLQPLFEAVRQSVALCQLVQRHHLTTHRKTDREPVTIADYGSQAILCRAIRRAFPDDAIIAEESVAQFLKTVPASQRQHIAELVGDIIGQFVTETDVIDWLSHAGLQTTACTWVIDPLDGTRGFLAGRRWSVAVGLLVDGRPVAGLLACPDYDGGRLFYAWDGHAYHQPLSGGPSTPINVSSTRPANFHCAAESMPDAPVDQAAIAHVYQTLGNPTPHIHRADGQDKYGLVACGDADLYLRIPADHEARAKIWDHVTGVALIEAAGGRVTDVCGNPLDFTQIPVLHSAKFVIITNGHLHQPVINTLQSLCP